MAEKQTDQKAAPPKGKTKPKREQDRIDFNDPTLSGAEAVARNLQAGQSGS